MVFFKKYTKNDNFLNFLKTKSDPNTRQNAPNCIIFNNFLVGACPRVPLAERMASRHANFQIRKKFLGPPPYQTLATPLTVHAILT